MRTSPTVARRVTPPTSTPTTYLLASLARRESYLPNAAITATTTTPVTSDSHMFAPNPISEPPPWMPTTQWAPLASLCSWTNWTKRLSAPRHDACVSGRKSANGSIAICSDRSCCVNTTHHTSALRSRDSRGWFCCAGVGDGCMWCVCSYIPSCCSNISHTI